MEKPDENGPIHVTYVQDGEEKVDQYDTVLFAIGRYAITGNICLEKAGLVCESNGKFKVNEFEQTNVENIYAVGDVLYG